jgi:hypothetical protein
MVEAMVESKEEIIDLNVSQIESGITKEGIAIMPEYQSEEYAKEKKSMGSKAPLGTPDLKLTGDFLESARAEEYIGSNPESSGLFIESTDEKADKLESWYDNIWGIAPVNAAELQELIIDNAQKKIIYGLTKNT